MKRIIVTTYCTWTSIGSMLQALGLRNILSKNNYVNTILLKRGENEFHSIKVGSIKSFIIRLHQFFINTKRKTAFRKREDFLKEHYNIEYFETEADCRARIKQESIECVLTGSDQIWNPTNMNPFFFLEFADNVKKISYAASMGNTVLNSDSKSKFEEYLKDFEYISVRETECKEILQPLVKQNIDVNIDPVFLCSAEEWRKYEVSYPVKKPYILLYMLFWDKSCKEKIIRLKKETGLQVIAISNQLSSVYADKILYDVGPGEFLWLIDNAEYVVSSSFHGIAMSTIFNKRFSAVINPKAPSRIKHLLRTLEIPNVEIDELNSVNPFNYKEINNCIKKECEKSRQYLEKALNNEYIRI